MGKPKRYSPEVKERAVRMVLEHLGEHGSQWGAIRSYGVEPICAVLPIAPSVYYE